MLFRSPASMALSRTALPVLAACTGLLLAPRSGDSQVAEDLEATVTRQAAELVALQGRVEALEAFARSQASAEEAFAAAAERARDAGFTAGINPRSREILLEGLRTQAKAMQSGEAEAKKDDRRSRSRQSRRRDR